MFRKFSTENTANIFLILALLFLLYQSCSNERTPEPPKDKPSVAVEEEYKIIPYDQPVWDIETMFNQESMKETVSIRTAGLFKLHQEFKKETPELGGKLVLHFFVHPDGSVSDVEMIESEWSDFIQGELLADSMAAHVGRWTFPEGAAKPIGVTQPWVFNP